MSNKLLPADGLSPAADPRRYELKMKDSKIIIGKSIIKRFFDYYEDVGLDDETEFFPILKIIISGVVEALKDDSRSQNIEKELKEYSKQLYVSLWILHAEEDKEEIDIEYERKAAIRQFEDIYRKV